MPGICRWSLLAGVTLMTVFAAVPPGAAAGATGHALSKPAGTAVTGSALPSARSLTERSGTPSGRPTGNVIVKFKTTSSSRRGTAQRQTVQAVAQKVGEPLRSGRALGNGATLVSGADPTTAVTVAKELSARPDVDYAEPDMWLRAAAPPTDPYYLRQWNLAETLPGIRAASAWNHSRGSGAVVAVVDTGLVSHPDLPGEVLPGFDFISDARNASDGSGRDLDPSDPGDWTSVNECSDGAAASPSSWHGTAVAGVVAAAADNGMGIAGVAPGAAIMPVRVLGKCGGSLSDIADALTWASGGSVPGTTPPAKPAQVANLSLAAPGTCSATMQRAVDEANRRGTTVVVAAGNSAGDAGGYTPGNCRDVVTVSAVDAAGRRASYSNNGSAVTLAAPGGDVAGPVVWSTGNTGSTRPERPSYPGMIGTSLAAPHVSGAAALVLSARPGQTPSQVRSALAATARRSCLGCGAGIVDAAAAVALARTPPESRVRTAPRVTGLSVGSGPISGGNRVTVKGLSLGGTTAVTFGGTKARILARSDRTVSVLAPRHKRPGTVLVRVTTPSGTSSATRASRYRYLSPPVVTLTSPRVGLRRGGALVLLRGNNLSAASSVYFGTARASRLRLLSSRGLLVTAPWSALRGRVYLRVRTPGGLSSRTRAATYTYR